MWNNFKLMKIGRILILVNFLIAKAKFKNRELVPNHFCVENTLVSFTRKLHRYHFYLVPIPNYLFYMSEIISFFLKHSLNEVPLKLANQNVV